MESMFRAWDGEDCMIRSDKPTGAWIIIAIHSSRLGIGTGGTRMKPYPGLMDALQDALNLSASMTFKFAVANFPRGGAKAVISLPSDFNPEDRPKLLRRYGKLVYQLGGRFQTGPDVGTSSEDMDIIAETGNPHVFCRTPAKGGAGDSGPATALGVFSGMRAVCEQLFGTPSLKCRRVLIQGVGSVGKHLIDHLRHSGADVLFSDVDPVAVEYFSGKLKLPFIAPEAVYDTPCDIFSPCALGGILNKKTISRLKCLAIAGAANNQLAEPSMADELKDNGILYAPDYAINIGGAMAIIGMETMGWSPKEAEERVQSVKTSLNNIFQIAQAEDITPDAAARQIAESRLL